MEPISFQELVQEFDPANHAALRRLLAHPDTDALVVFENQDLNSSNLGMKSALAVGPGRTYKSVAECAGKWLHDLPSQRQYAVRYCLKETSTNADGNHGADRKSPAATPG